MTGVQTCALPIYIDCGRIRTFGNNFPKGMEKEDVIKYVGESLREVGEFAADYNNVDVLLEMQDRKSVV